MCVVGGLVSLPCALESSPLCLSGLCPAPSQPLCPSGTFHPPSATSPVAPVSAPVPGLECCVFVSSPLPRGPGLGSC